MKTRSLSPTEAKVVLSLESEGAVDVTLRGIRERTRISEGFARKVAHTLVRKGWLQRVGRGRYLLNPSRHGPDAIADTDPFRFGSRVVSPYYFGYATAAELLGLLPQASRVYYLVTPVPGSSPAPHAAKFRRIRTQRSRFFGARTLRRRGEALRVSDLERTVLDCLARPDLAGGIAGVVQVIDSAGESINWDRLDRYLHRLGARSLQRRLGYLVERLGLRTHPPARWMAEARSRPGEPYLPLGPPREFGRRGRHDPLWRIIENVPEAQLRAEVDVR